MIRQVGAVAVQNLDEMIDVVKATLLTRRPSGNRLGLIAMTGGQSVVLTDAFEKAGWKVPTLTEASYAQLAEFFNIIGGSYRNPLDAAGTIGQSPEHLDTIFDILNADENIDAVAMELSATFMARRWQDKPEEFERLIISLKRFMAESDKPFLTALHPSHVEPEALAARQRLQQESIPTFPQLRASRQRTAQVGGAAGDLTLESSAVPVRHGDDLEASKPARVRACTRCFRKMLPPRGSRRRLRGRLHAPSDKRGWEPPPQSLRDSSPSGGAIGSGCSSAARITSSVPSKSVHTSLFHRRNARKPR